MFSQSVKTATETEAQTLTLADARPGETYRIISISPWDGREQLLRMGLVEGSEVYCITAFGHGPVAVRSGRTNIAIGWGLARQIMVKKVEKMASGVGRPVGVGEGRWFDGFAQRNRHRFGRRDR
ncbi:MAG TPA: ferrous iron transport protein A [Firmicutes bacterium]|nr:ferrous iron transport protein A [Bacillota bacterium]